MPGDPENCIVYGIYISFFLLFIQPVGLGFLHLFFTKKYRTQKLDELSILHVNEDDFFFYKEKTQLLATPLL
jgi:hypothetical protein